MKPTILLRIAAVISGLFAFGHVLGGLQQWNPVGANPVFALMAKQQFHVEGATRSYLDLYLGLGWSSGVLLILQTVLLWQLSTLARADGARLRPMIAAIALATAATGAIARHFILPIPALFSFALLVPLVLAFAAPQPRRSETTSDGNA
jgi:hypothetical protein